MVHGFEATGYPVSRERGTVVPSVSGYTYTIHAGYG